MHVLQIGCHLDPEQRPPRALLEAWPTLPAVAEAAALAGVAVTVVQAAHVDEVFQRNEVTYRFVQCRSRLAAWQPLSRVVPAPRVASSVGRARPDVIHFHGFSLGGCLRSIRSASPTVPIIAQHHGEALPRRWWRTLARRGIAHVDAVMFTAREQAAPFFSNGVLRAGLPVHEVLECSSHFRPGDQQEARRATGLLGEPCVLWVGRLNQNKDPLSVLRAIQRALRELPALHLWCVYTESPLLGEVRGLLESDTQLSDHVHLLGSMPHARIEQACRAADLYVSGSHREGSGYALIEALACGLTPVVTDIPSFRRITRNGAVGALVPPGDVEGMAAALVHLAARDRSRLRQRARAHFEECLSFPVLGRELCAAYEDVKRPGPSL